MEEKFYKQKGFYLTLLTSILIISISLITQYKKTLFVNETGNIKIFGSWGMLLAIGLLLKWKFVREILGVFSMTAFAVIIFMTFKAGKEFIFSYVILLTALTVVFVLLFFSKSVERYLKSR